VAIATSEATGDGETDAAAEVERGGGSSRSTLARTRGDAETDERAAAPQAPDAGARGSKSTGHPICHGR
jgi:hypothetical protein